MSSAPYQLHVNVAQPYRIVTGKDLLHDSASFTPFVRGRHILIVSDTHVAPLYLARLIDSLQATDNNYQIDHFIIPAGEASKNLTSFASALEHLAKLGATRDACVIALGGGVVGDLAGFAAACWMRGIDYIQVPTTLLAMVDSSVGGKTAIDTDYGKNLIGAFHHPRAVIADTSTLQTLPAREFQAGMAEVIKSAAIRDPEFFSWLTEHRSAVLAQQSDQLAFIIQRSCEQKAVIVERDPYEKGERALLNFGHTFAHAIEAEQGYTPTALNHGEAVSVGMCLAAKLSTRLTLASDSDQQKLSDLLQSYRLPVVLPEGLDPDRLLRRMSLDKKNTAGSLRFILWHGIGKAFIANAIDASDVMAVLTESIAESRMLARN